MSQMAKVVEGTAVSDAVPTGLSKVSKAIGSSRGAWISPMARTRNGAYACALPLWWGSVPNATAERPPRGSVAGAPFRSGHDVSPERVAEGAKPDSRNALA